MQSTMHVYEVKPRRDHRDVDLISDVLPFGRLWCDTPACRKMLGPKRPAVELMSFHAI